MKCQKCGQREGTIKFGEDFMSINHGMYQMWCNQCALIEQLLFAMRQAARIQILSKELATEMEQEENARVA